MASTQQFPGDYHSQSHQLIGSNFNHSNVYINTSDPKDRGNSIPAQGDSRRKFAEWNRDEVDGGPESSLPVDLSWDDCVQSLVFEGLRYRESVIDGHTDGTCEWLFESPAYLHWVDEHGLLLIRGKPGCGKSTLLKFALAKHLEAVATTGPLVMSFFFYSSGTELQKTIEGLFRTLLLQLFEQDVSSKLSFHEICRKHWDSEGKKNDCLVWNQKELQAIFERLVLECSTRRKITIFVDAVDECADHDRDRLISFFHKLKGKAQVKSNRPRVCFTCRLYPDGQIDADFRIRLEEENQYDIQNFIERELRLPDETESAVNELKQILRNNADGLFLWLVLVIQQVHDMSSKGLSLKLIESEILKCPRELDGLYEDLLKKIEDRELVEVGRLFQWICFAQRPLSLDELRTAITVHMSGIKGSLEEYEDQGNPNYVTNERKMKKRMIHLSRGLADIVNPKSAEEKSVVGFYHETIKNFMLTKGLEYLNRRNSRLMESRGLAETAHFQLANTCVNYLSTKEICIGISETRMRFPKRFCFLDYAATYWLAHAVEAEKEGSGESVTWPSQSTLNTWVQARRVEGTNSTLCPEEGTSLMHIAAEHGLERLAKSIYITTRRKVPAWIQVKFRICYIMNWMTRGLKFDAATTKAQSAIINARNKAGESPLHLAARCGELRMARFLHEHDIELGRVNVHGCTALYIASENGHLEVVKFLYDHGADADIHTPTNDGRTPLYSASENGHLEVVKFLHDHGADADIHTPDKNGWTPFNSASLKGNLEVVKFLHDHGADADIHTPDKNGWTPFNSASNNGHLEVVKFLYEHGGDADIHTPTNVGWTPLRTASYNGHLEVVKFLYEHGAAADIHTPDENGWTPFNSASNNGHLEVVKFLYKHGAGADIHTPDNDGWTPFYSASSNGHLEVVKFLYDHGADADIHTPDKNGWTPFNSASLKGNLEVVKFLYDHGADADIHTPDNDGWTPFYSASSNGHLEVVKFLYDHGADADIHTPDNDGWTPFNSASNNGHLEVVKFLYEHGANADIHTASNNGQTPIYAASSNGHLEVVKFLFDHGADADIHTSDNNGWTPLYSASRNCHLEVVKFSHDRGADADIHKPDNTV